MKFEKICVLGLGYIGLPTASTFAIQGVKVIGVDTNPQIVETLKNGDLHIHEPGLRTVVQAALQSGNLVIAGQPEEADVFIIAVPTPFFDDEENGSDKRADLSYVVSAAESILPLLRPGNLVVLESTSPPCTTVDIVAPILERSGIKVGSGLYLAYTPERVLPGQILRELVENARVIGGIDRASAEAGRDLYAIFVRGEIILTDATTAEMVKLMENTYRDVNIAVANEFGRLAERFGVDVWEAIAIANHHPRVEILRPGPGVGGHCIGVDPWFLVEAAPDLSRLIRTARLVNDEQPEVVVHLIQSAFRVDARAGLAGKRITILGLAYKADVDDLRESPAIEIACLLQAAGAQVTAFEPFVRDHTAKAPAGKASFSGVALAPTLEVALEKADLLVLLVRHTTFLQLDPRQVANLTPARLVVDAVNGFPTAQWEASGFKILRLGVGK